MNPIDPHSDRQSGVCLSLHGVSDHPIEVLSPQAVARSKWCWLCQLFHVFPIEHLPTSRPGRFVSVIAHSFCRPPHRDR